MKKSFFFLLNKLFVDRGSDKVFQIFLNYIQVGISDHFHALDLIFQRKLCDILWFRYQLQVINNIWDNHFLQAVEVEALTIYKTFFLIKAVLLLRLHLFCNRL